jgi:hypothetical protein
MVGAGSQPATAAVSVWPTTAGPVIVGAGDVVNGIPAAIGAVAFEVRLVVIYPDLVAVART